MGMLDLDTVRIAALILGPHHQPTVKANKIYNRRPSCFPGIKNLMK